MSAPHRPRRGLANTIRITVAVVLGGIGGAAGFTHSHDWATHHGQTGWLAWAVAVVIEGMVIVAGFEIHRDHQQPGPHRKITFPIVVLVIGFGIQMAAQVALAEPTPAGWLIAAIPALGFLTVVKLLTRTTPHPQPTPTPTPEPATVPEPAPEPGVVPESAPVHTPAAVPESAAIPEPVPAASTQEPVHDTTPEPEPEPTIPAGAPVPVSRVKLPPDVAARIADALDAVRSAGRTPTTEDIRRAVKLPEPMAARLLAEHTGNGHTLTH